MTSLRPAGGRTRTVQGPPRIGLFGLLGQGNLGNDASLEAALAYLRAEHPDVTLDCLCSGASLVSARYGMPATDLHVYRPTLKRRGPAALGVKSLVGVSLFIDTYRMASWVRRHDIVIVPGMGVLEVTIPQRPWQTPYLMCLLSTSGRLFGTKIVLISAGASVIDRPLTRWFVITAARLAYYRSFRDDVSKDAMRQMGLDTARDAVYPDIAFSDVQRYDDPAPTCDDPAPTCTVGIGLMTYYGGNSDRPHSDEIYASYVVKMKRFVGWLIDNGRQVRLLVGDIEDERVVQEIVSAVRAQRPQLAPTALLAEPVSTVAGLMRQIASVDTVVATRFHNIVFALKLGKPTIALGYAAKHEALMAEMDLADYYHSVKSLDVDQLIEQFTDLERRSLQIRPIILGHCAAKARLVADQFQELSAALFRTSTAAHVSDERTADPSIR